MTGHDHEVHRCEAKGCNRRRRACDVLCTRCFNTLAGVCEGKQRVPGWTARTRGKRTGRGAYRCPAGVHHHQTRTEPGPGAYVIRTRAKAAVRALIEHNGQRWFDQLVASWDPDNGATPRAGKTTTTTTMQEA
jgi:hypothetical protein